MCILSLNFKKSVLREDNHIWQRTDGWMSSLHEELLQVDNKNRQFNRKVREIHEHLFQRRGNMNGQKHEKMFKFISKQVNAKKTTMRCHSHATNWYIWKFQSFKNTTFSKIGEDVEQWAFSYLVVGIHFGAVTLETNAVLPNLIKYMCILEPSSSTVSYLANWL